MNVEKIKKDKRLLWILFASGLLWLCTFANRAVLSPMISLIQDKWVLTGAEVGILGSVIYLSYFIFQIPGGMIADKWDRRKMMILSGILQGIAVLGCGYFDHIYGFLFSRFLTGIFSTAIFSSSFAYLASILPLEEKIMGIGIVQSFMSLGIVIGTVLTSEIVFRYNLSRGTPFIIIGFAIMLSTFVLYLLFPGRKDCSPGVDEKNMEPVNAKSGWLNVKELLRNKTLFNLFIIAFIQCYSLFMMMTWLPYFFRQSGFSALEAGNLSSFAYILAIPAILIIAVSLRKLKKIKQLKKPLLAIMSTNLLSTAPLHIHLITQFSKLKN